MAGWENKMKMESIPATAAHTIGTSQLLVAGELVLTSVKTLPGSAKTLNSRAASEVGA